MADKPGAKPGAKKPEPSKGLMSDMSAGGKLTVMLIALAVIGAVAARLSNVVEVSSEAGEPSAAGFISYLFSRTGLLEAVYRLIGNGWFLFISGLLSVLFAALALYSFWQFRNIRLSEKETLRLLDAKLTVDASGARNERWERILSLVASDNPGDWRVAIIEADIALEELMRSMSYHGDTLGDMLKAVEKSDFQTLDLAWEGHKVRNRIAHSGSDYILTNREAKRIIDLYRQVFQEFDVI
jgi:hypothetical protein